MICFFFTERFTGFRFRSVPSATVQKSPRGHTSAETKVIAARAGICAAEKARGGDPKALDNAKRNLAAIALTEAGGAS